MQFISNLTIESVVIWASKGLHMVSAVHPVEAFPSAIDAFRLQRGCTWLVQFINAGHLDLLERPRFKGAAHG